MFVRAKYITFLIITAIALCMFAACGSQPTKLKNTLLSQPEKNHTDDVKEADDKTTPESTVKLALNLLRDGVYTSIAAMDAGQQGGGVDSELMDEVFENFSFTIKGITEHDELSATVTVEMVNLDLNSLGDEIENNRMGLSAQQKKESIKAVTQTKTHIVDVLVRKGSNGYEISNKSEMYAAASGGFLKEKHNIPQTDENTHSINKDDIGSNLTDSGLENGSGSGPTGGPKKQIESGSEQ